MRKYLALFCLLSAGSAAAQDRWRTLLDGKTLKGWQARSTSNPKANGDWTVSKGALLCPGTTAGWLSTDEVFTDYHLKLQFRGDAKVNSGVFLRSQKEGQPHITGYELQIWDYQPAGYDTGSLVGTVKAPAVRILGDKWNDYDITVQGDHFVIVLNGKPLLDAHDSAHTSGVIGFQCQVNNKIEFRNIRIMPLGK